MQECVCCPREFLRSFREDISSPFVCDTGFNLYLPTDFDIGFFGDNDLGYLMKALYKINEEYNGGPNESEFNFVLSAEVCYWNERWEITIALSHEGGWDILLDNYTHTDHFAYSALIREDIMKCPRAYNACEKAILDDDDICDLLYWAGTQKIRVECYNSGNKVKISTLPPAKSARKIARE